MQRVLWLKKIGNNNLIAKVRYQNRLGSIGAHPQNHENSTFGNSEKDTDADRPKRMGMSETLYHDLEISEEWENSSTTDELQTSL